MIGYSVEKFSLLSRPLNHRSRRPVSVLDYVSFRRLDRPSYNGGEEKRAEHLKKEKKGGEKQGGGDGLDNGFLSG